MKRKNHTPEQIIKKLREAVIGRFKTSHSWALQTQPVEGSLIVLGLLSYVFGSRPGGRFGWF